MNIKYRRAISVRRFFWLSRSREVSARRETDTRYIHAVRLADC